MILSATKVLELNKEHSLIENLDERELTNPEGVGIDLRVGEVYRLSGEGYLGVEERKTPDAKIVASAASGDKEVLMKPGDFLLVKTIERVNVPGKKIVVTNGKEPRFLALFVTHRSTLHRCGILFMATKTDPGYSGELVFGLKNVGGANFRLELGARIANAVFFEVDGDIHRAYEGQWGGGRVATGAKEVQK